MPETRFSSEVDLLIACARTRLEPVHQSQIDTLLQSGMDWENVWNLGQMHGMLPLLYWHINRVSFDGIPKGFKEKLEARFRENTTRNFLLTKALKEISLACEREHIPMIAYKGVVLAQHIYKNLSLRHFNDLDLFVSKQDLTRISKMLGSLGYFPAGDLSPRQQAARLRYGCESGCVGKDGRVLVDLHWSITPGELKMGLYNAQVWDRAIAVQIAGSAVQTLSPADLMFVLCLHGSKPVHGWARLNWICDLAELAWQLSPQDWEILILQAQNWKVERMVYLGLHLANDLIAIQLPDLISERIKNDAEFVAMRQQIYQRMFRDLSREPGTLESIVFYLRTSATLKERFIYTLRRIFTPTHEDWETRSMPVWLYYFYRPFRLLGKFL